MSQAESNKVDRMLSGKLLKYTITIHRLDGSKIEFQADDSVELKWNDSARGLFIHKGGYPDTVITEYEKGMVIMLEKNPGAP